MPLTIDITTVVALIETHRVDQAVSFWSSLRETKQCCSPCFYSPLEANVRCASCLESHLSTALLKRSYPQVTPDRLQGAKHALSDWIGQSDHSI